MSKETIGVLVMSYGTPESMDQVEEYYTHIRRGNPPTKEQLDELEERYEAIGGFFPLRQNTNRQVEALQALLNEDHASEYNFVCYQGLKHARPYIEDGVKQMAADGIKRAVSIVLAPHYSVMSIGTYNKRAHETAQEVGIDLLSVDSYHLHPALIDAHVDRVNESLAQFEGNKESVRLIFTAHSLPERILEMNDPYVDQMHETSNAIAKRVGTANWQFAWQSAGQTAMPWLGPDILDVLEKINKEEQVDKVLICPIGFVSDHLEILYDIDIECKDLAQKLGMHLERTRSLNTDPQYIEVLTDSVYSKIEKE
ncbi:ferrochelatase [Caldalkalibacillus salinus]|uniref:ferrochelatase n=1 Tax=Caldalkalibacillus salinus TaxID=2803787 RepID=UPI0019247247|nr:ferrochelatase [Caldalkalibacillus salinus]